MSKGERPVTHTAEVDRNKASSKVIEEAKRRLKSHKKKVPVKISDRNPSVIYFSIPRELYVLKLASRSKRPVPREPSSRAV